MIHLQSSICNNGRKSISQFVVLCVHGLLYCCNIMIDNVHFTRQFKTGINNNVTQPTVVIESYGI